MRTVLGILVALALGLGSAFFAVRGGLAAGDVANGPWRTNSTTGSADADLYTRARVSIAGLLALAPAETRPLSVTVPLTPPYTSLSGFAANTDNFFAINDRAAGASEIAVIVIGPSTPRGEFADGRVIESPSDRGVLLVRRVVPSAAAFAEIDAVRRRASAVLR